MLDLFKLFFINYMEDHHSLFHHINDYPNIIDDTKHMDSKSNKELDNEEMDNIDNEGMSNHIKGVIGGVILGHRSNGGDSSSGDGSTGDSGIPNIEVNYSILSLIKGTISQIFHCGINTIMPIQFHVFWWMMKEYTPCIWGMLKEYTPCIWGMLKEYTKGNYPNIYEVIAELTAWSINHWDVYLSVLTLFTLIYIKLCVIPYLIELSKSFYSIFYTISSFNFTRFSDIGTGLHHSNSWTNPPGGLVWDTMHNLFYQTMVFKKYLGQLGLRYMGNINMEFYISEYNLTHAGIGLKNLIDNVFCSTITQVRTFNYNKSLGKRVYGIFNILVLSGIGVVVWYRYVPCDNINQLPPLLHNPLNNVLEFQNPDAVIDGYKRVCFLIKKDIMNTVLTTFTQDPTFKEILDVRKTLEEAPHINNAVGKNVLAGVCTALMIASFIATNVLVLPSPS